MDPILPTLATLLAVPLYVNVCDPAPCRTVEVRADGDRVVIVGDATPEQVLSVVLRTLLSSKRADEARIKAFLDALPNRVKARE